MCFKKNNFYLRKYIFKNYTKVKLKERRLSIGSFVNRALNICSEPISFNSEIQYLKGIAPVRGYNLYYSIKLF